MVGDTKPKALVPESVAAALAGIRADFIEGLVPLINEIEYQRLAVGNPSAAPQALESLGKAAHKLSGMAGSVGFPLLGEHAAQLDMALSQMRRGQGGTSAIAALDGPLEELLDLMEAALDEEF